MCPPADPDAPGINAGFTLIEALVALAVIAISLAVIGSVVAANVRGTITVDQRISLLETARSLLTALPDRGDLTPGNTSGEMGGNRWRIDVLPFAAHLAACIARCKIAAIRQGGEQRSRDRKSVV